jgi:hypothetical protein
MKSFSKYIFLFLIFQQVSSLSAQDDTVRSQEVNIKVYKNSRSEKSLTNDIKSAGLVLSGISSERIGSLQVSSANEVVRKITGVTVMDDGKLVIRGVSPRYNVVLLDGFKAPSFDPDVRLFSLDVLPANVLDNIKVVKSPSAEYPSDFSGGIVNIETLSLPDKNEWRAQFSLGADFQTFGSDFYSQSQKQPKYLGFNRKANALPEDVKIDHLDKKFFSVAERIAISEELPHNFYPESQSQYIPNWKLQLMKTNRIKLNNKKAFLGTSHLVAIENSYESRTMRRSSVATDPVVQRVINFSDETFVQTIRSSALNNFTYGNENGLRIDLKTLFVNNAEYGALTRKGKALPGAYGENGVYENIAFKQFTTNNTFRDFFISSINIKLPIQNEKIDWTLGANANFSRFLDQDRKSALLTRDDNPSGTTTTFNYKEDYVSTMDQLRFGRWYYELPENMLQYKTDVKYTLNANLNLQTGFRYDITNRKFDLRSMGMVNKVWADTVQQFSGQLLDEYTWPYNSYTANYSTTAGYLMSNYKTKKLNINAGVRVEKTSFKLNSEGFETLFSTRELIRRSLNVFPSLNTTYNFSNSNLIRGAIGYSSNRPELREYSPLRYLDIRNWLTASGNGNLKPVSMILNGEVRFEHYQKNSNYHIGAFYKKINNPVVAKAIDPNAFAFVNMDHAIVYGSEIEFSQTIKFSKKSLIENIQIIGNASLNFSTMFENKSLNDVDSIVNLNQPLVGQSPYLANIQISAYLKKNKGHITLSGFYQGERVVFTGDEGNFYSLIQKTGVLLNLTSSYNITKKTSIRCKIDNILNTRDLLYSDLNKNGKLEFYEGYISDTKNDTIFSCRRDPTVISFSLLTSF